MDKSKLYKAIAVAKKKKASKGATIPYNREKELEAINKTRIKQTT
jgi:hypothetical protein